METPFRQGPLSPADELGAALPLRKLILSPQKLLSRLDVESDWKVLELGSGPGYFSPFVARALPDGELCVVDVQEEMIAQANRRLRKYEVENASTRVTDGTTLEFPSATFDCAFLVTVLGEIEDAPAMIREVHRVLKPGGRLSVTELAGDPDTITLDDMQTLLEPIGFRFERRFGQGRNYTANFLKN